MRHFVSCFLLILAIATVALHAAPFAVDASSQLQTDFTVSWASISSAHGTSVPDGTAVAASDSGAGVTVSSPSAQSLSIWNQAGLFTSGVLLSDPGPDGIVLELGRAVQGVGVTVEHKQSVTAEYRMDFYDGTGAFLFGVATPSPGASGNPAFLGGVDPDARIRRVVITATPDNDFVITDPKFQLKPVPVDDFANLPVASQQTVEVSPTATYLHQGLGNRDTDQETTMATLSNPNAFNLAVLFPNLQPGDVLRVERLGFTMLSGSQMNNVIAVFSSSQTLLAGTAFARVPDAIPAGRNVFTNEITGAQFNTPTNIPQDFLVGASTFLGVPADAAYLFFSLAQPGPNATPVNVRLSHLPRAQFLEWAASFGLHGSLADLESDADGDGLTLLEEFAFMKDPTVSDAGTPADFAFVPHGVLLDGGSGGHGRLTLLFGARLNGPLRYRAEFSSDLVNWNDVVTGALPYYPDETDSSRSIFSVTDPGDGPRRFGRLRIEYIAPGSP